MRGRRFVVMIMAVLAVALVGATAALAQDGEPYPPPPTASCTSSAVEPGDTLTCSAPGFEPGSDVTVEVLGTGFERTFGTVADENGVATITFTVPEDAAPGPGTVTLTGPDASGGVRTATAEFTVLAAGGEATTGDTGGLVTTGAPVSNGVLVALGVIVAGGALVVAGRRRQRDVEVGS